MKACDLAKGTVVELNGDPHIVEQLRTQTPSARGAATLYKVRFRNLRTRSKLDQTYKGDDALKECEFDTRKVEFSYSEGDRFTFMDTADYTQYELMRDELGDATDYLVQLVERDPEHVIPLEDVADGIAAELRRREYDRLEKIWLNTLRGKYYVQVFANDLFK